MIAKDSPVAEPHKTFFSQESIKEIDSSQPLAPQTTSLVFVSKNEEDIPTKIRWLGTFVT